MKFGRRHANTPAVVTVAVRLVTLDGGVVTRRPGRARRAGPHPRRWRPPRPRSRAGRSDEATIARRGRRPRRDAADPLADAVASDWYRRRMVGVFVRRALEELAQGVAPGGRREMASSDRRVRARRARGGGPGRAADHAPGRAPDPARPDVGQGRLPPGRLRVSCTVLVDGEPMLSCLLPVEDVEGRRVTTVEALTPAGGLHPIQRAFLDGNGFQCGYCTPGMEMLATALLDHNPSPSRDEIVDALAGQHLPLHGLRADRRRDRRRRGGRRTGTADDRRAAGPPRRRRVGRRAATASGFVTGRAQYTRRPHVPGDAPPADGPQPAPPRPDPRRRPVRGRAGARASSGRSPTRTCRTTCTRSSG